MNDPAHQDLRGRCLLVVEDDYLIALDLAQWLEELGLHVIGPAGSVADALKLVEHNADKIDGALLDVNLHGERVYPVAVFPPEACLLHSHLAMTKWVSPRHTRARSGTRSRLITGLSLNGLQGSLAHPGGAITPGSVSFQQQMALRAPDVWASNDKA